MWKIDICKCNLETKNLYLFVKINPGTVHAAGILIWFSNLRKHTTAYGVHETLKARIIRNTILPTLLSRWDFNSAILPLYLWLTYKINNIIIVDPKLCILEEKYFSNFIKSHPWLNQLTFLWYRNTEMEV